MACINVIPINDSDFGGRADTNCVPEEEETVLPSCTQIKDGGAVLAVLPDVLANGGDIRTSDGCVRNLLVEKPEAAGEHVGFNLTRSQWDPYPWVRTVDENSAAGRAGLKEGDCLLRVESQDLLGLKVTDVAKLVRGAQREVRLLVWSSGPLADWDPDSLFCGPIPGALRRLGACLGAVLRAAECPVCQATVAPPASQCPRGHLLCSTCCRSLTVCPLCRAPMPARPLRNLLADEVYNSVVEAFELHANNKNPGSLTQRLFGDTKIIKTERRNEENYNNNGQDGGREENNDNNSAAGERRRQNGEVFDAHDGPSRGIKWGTQRLLQRLLPGRARSTGNIARAARSPNRNSTLAEDTNLSRSLSTLDIVRSSEVSSQTQHAGSNSLNSLACTAGGSCGSLPPVVFVSGPDGDQDDVPPFIDEGSSTSSGTTASSIKNSSTIQHGTKKGYFCPADPDCDEIITGDVQQHILSCHGLQVTLRPDQEISLSPRELKNGHHDCQALLHPSGQWFYPKCERDESENGVRVWCWALASSSTSSDYQIEVEVWPNEEFKKYGEKMLIKNENNEEKHNQKNKTDVKINNIELGDNKIKIGKDFENSDTKNSFDTKLVGNDYKIEFNDDVLNNNNQYDLNNYKKSTKFDKNVQNTKITPKTRIFGPLLKYAAPVLSLKSASWSKVLASRQALFLGDSLLANDAWVKLSIDKIE